MMTAPTLPRLWIAAFFLGAAVAHGLSAPRIAIIDLSRREGLEPLLVAALAKQPELEAVERPELTRLVEEKRLTELVGQRQLAALGALLRADGLLVLEKLALPGEPAPLAETARLVSVRNGACLLFVPVPLKDGQPLPEWAAGVSGQVTRAAPSLLVAQGSAVPISVLNLRAAILTPNLVTLESGLTRLLEMRLSALPKAVLLERRRLGDAAFERSLEAADLPPLSNGLVLVDGSFEAPGSAANKVAMKLRLRRADGTELAAATVTGQADAPAALAEAMAESIAGLLPEAGGRLGVARVTEPAEFFKEAVWAWQNGMLEKAEEALAAAQALGEKSPDAAALQAWLLSERAALSASFRVNWDAVKRPLPPPAEQHIMFQQALSALAEYHAAGAQLKKIGGLPATRLQAVALRHHVIEPASEVLRANDEAPQPLEVSALRLAVHNAAGMEATGAAMPYSLATSGRHAADWARDHEELLAFYEKLLRSDHQWISALLRHFPRSADAALGPRFRRDPAAIAGLSAMWERLKKEPSTRLRALILLATWPESPEQAASYRAYLRELGAQAPALYARRQIGALLEADNPGLGFQWKFQPERAALLLQLCETLPGFVPELHALTAELKIPAGQEQKVWTAFTQYRDRCLLQATEKERAPRADSFAWSQSLLLKQNPSIRVAQTASGLLVNRFCHPYAQLVPKGNRHSFVDFVVSVSSVWDVPVYPAGTVFEASLPGLRTTAHQIEGIAAGGSLCVTPDAIWVSYTRYRQQDKTTEYFLTRKDRKSGEEKTYPLPRGGPFSLVNGRAFIELGQARDAGLAELDLATGELNVLASPRRNPPLSRFDGQARWRSQGVIAGPGGVPSVVLIFPESGLFEIGGSWKKISAVQVPPTVQPAAKSLVVDGSGGTLLIDPAQPQGRWLLAGPKSPPEVRDAAPWEMPAGLERQGNAETRAFREGQLFVLLRDPTGAYRLRWWFATSPREGLDIPLRFELGAQDRAVIDPHRDAFKGVVPHEALLNPMRGLMHMKLLATPEGLILSPLEHGFWFIPYADLDKHAASLAKKPR